MTKKEMVNHPSHYQSDKGIEVIDVIEAFSLGFCLGNVVKYVLRAGVKLNDPKEWASVKLEDLKKARWYLGREIGNLERMVSK